MRKIPIGVLGATGMVGQRFITLLNNHPWFDLVVVAASPNSADKTYKEAVRGRWVIDETMPKKIEELNVYSVERDLKKISDKVRLVFSALDLEKEKIKEIENAFAKNGVGVISNNSANRWSEDVPMILPEINPDHLELIEVQKKRRKYKNGFIVVKPNCSIQSYVPPLTALLKFLPQKVIVTTFQAVSGAGKTLSSWPQMNDNVIPFILGEEQKSEDEPMRIWGKIKNEKIEMVKKPDISATCIRVPVSNGHMAAVSVLFAKKPTEKQILNAWISFNPLSGLSLPMAPKPFIKVYTEDDRPQINLDRDLKNGMGVSVGRLRKDPILDYKFIGLSHNTIRGAAGGAILTAELLKAKNYL